MPLYDKIVRDAKSHPNEAFVALLMIAFIVTDVEIPHMVAKYVDTMAGRAVVYAVAVLMFLHHPVLGVISLLFAYEFLHRCEKKSGSWQMRRYEPSQKRRDATIRAANYVPYTLEEEMVKQMVPFANYGKPVDTSFLPVAHKTHNATQV